MTKSNQAEASNSSTRDSHVSDEIDFYKLFLILWSGRKLISGVSGFAAIASVVVALLLPNVYTASALLSPAEESSGGLSSLMGQYGGLASLAGVSLPSGNDGSKAQLGIQILKSRIFIGNFVNRHNLLPDLMAVDRWDAVSKTITYDPAIYDVKQQIWTRKFDPPLTAKPSLQEAFKQFQEIMSISEDAQTGYVSISIEHKSPIVAAQWVEWLVSDLNATVKDQDVSEATRSIEYLKQQISSTSLAELRAMFFELIQSQTETVMLAEVRPEYVFKTIDPAVAPEEESQPNRILICIFGTMLGIILGSLVVFFRRNPL